MSFNCFLCSSGILSISPISFAISPGVMFFIAAAESARVCGFSDSSSMMRRISSADGVEKREVAEGAVRPARALLGADWKAWLPVNVRVTAKIAEDATESFIVLMIY